MLTVHDRSEWGPAKPDVGRLAARDFHTIRELFIHWPGAVPRSWQHITTPGLEHDAIRGIQRYHMTAPDHRWADIAYNHVLCPPYGRATPPHHPTVYVARGLQYAPAGQLGHNEGTTALLILAGPDDLHHAGRLRDVVQTIRAFRLYVEHYAGHAVAVRPHRAVTQTDCPGDRLAAAIKGL
jgi:hypothetical protein